MGMANEMNPTDWGWKEESRQLIPKTEMQNHKNLQKKLCRKGVQPTRK